MPVYQYKCPENGRMLEALHPMDVTVTTWGELCRWAGVFPGSTDDDTPVERIFGNAPHVNTPTGDTRLKDAGFTKLVRRDDGSYDNVTASGREARTMRPEDPSTYPHLHKKMKD